MDRSQAEALYDSGKEPTVSKLLELYEENRRLGAEPGSVRLNSTNSSRPPSSDGPEVKKKQQSPTGLKQGAQPGHKGTCKKLLPVEQMDHVHELYPSRCEKCSLPVSPATNPETSEPFRHQVFDIPEKIEPVKTEYRSHELECTCGHSTRASLPQHAAQSNFGPRAHALISYLTSCHFGTRRGVCQILSTVFGVDISLGALCKALDRVNDALEEPAEKIREALVQDNNLNIDETGWKSRGERRTLWVFVAPLLVYFHIATSRGAAVLTSVLGQAFPGIITSDDASAYNCYHKGIRQLCWAHLIRKFLALQEVRGSPDACAFAKLMLDEIGNLFTCWYAFVDGHLSRVELRHATALIRGRMKRWCRHYKSSQDKAVCTRATKTLQNWPHLFTFIFHEGVEPTNNIAERALRFAVQWRKICFGSQSEAGLRFTERILTVTRTCRLQGKNPFHYLARVMEAPSKSTPIPSLVTSA